MPADQKPPNPQPSQPSKATSSDPAHPRTQKQAGQALDNPQDAAADPKAQDKTDAK